MTRGSQQSSGVAIFTPAPWEVHETDDGHEIRMASCAQDRTCFRPWRIIKYDHGCYVDDDYEAAQDDFAEAAANARLIAAAPELYQDLLMVSRQSGKLSHQQWQRLEATLAKARGES
jgi:hypothetical protein